MDDGGHPETSTAPVRVAVPRKGRPLEAVLDRLTAVGDGQVERVADEVVSTLRYEKAITKGEATADGDVYDRLARYSDAAADGHPEYTLIRDGRPGVPRRVVLDSLTVTVDGTPVQLVGREEPFRSLRKHEFALGFDSADLVLEEVVSLAPDPLTSLDQLNERIDPRDTDVQVVKGLGDTVHHTLLATPATRDAGPDQPLDRSFVADYTGPLCISPRYERLVRAILGTGTAEGVEFVYPGDEGSEEGAIEATGIGVYLTVTGSTARDHGLLVGERLFPSETVLLENPAEGDQRTRKVRTMLAGADEQTAGAQPSSGP